MSSRRLDIAVAQLNYQPILRLTLSAQYGVLSLSGTQGLDFTAGDGAADASMTFTGTQADVNAALTSLHYRVEPNSADADTVTIVMEVHMPEQATLGSPNKS